MANQNGRKRKVSLADLSAKILEEVARENAPPPEGAFTVEDVINHPAFESLKPRTIMARLISDKRLDSRVFMCGHEGKPARKTRYFWPRT